MRPAATRDSTNERLKRSLTRMASRLRPTPESGTVAATKMPASSLGPSWAARGSREARLAFRQAQKRGDREGAMRIAGEADKQGLASQASIGSAEERVAGQYQGRQADAAVTDEIETALTPPGPGRADGQPTKIGTAPSAASRFQQSQDVVSNTPASTVQPSIPAPGASQPPENPVSGSSTPVTGDPESRLGIRKPGRINGMPAGKAIGDAQSRVDAIPGRDKPSTSGAAGGEDDFLNRVGELTSAEGGDLMRGEAVRRANEERVVAGKAPRNVEQSLNALLGRDRDRDRTKRTAASLNRGPALSVDPTLARAFQDAVPKAEAAAEASAAARAARTSPMPSRSSLVGGSPATPAPTARPATLDAALRERQAYVADYANRPGPTGQTAFQRKLTVPSAPPSLTGPRAFEGSRAQAGLASASAAVSDTASAAAEGVRNTAARIAATQPVQEAKKRAAQLQAGVRKRAKGTAFEGSPIARLFGIGS